MSSCVYWVTLLILTHTSLLGVSCSPFCSLHFSGSRNALHPWLRMELLEQKHVRKEPCSLGDLKLLKLKGNHLRASESVWHEQ